MDQHYFPYLQDSLHERFAVMHQDMIMFSNRVEHVEHKVTEVGTKVELINRKLDQVLRQTNKKKPTKI